MDTIDTGPHGTSGVFETGDSASEWSVYEDALEQLGDGSETQSSQSQAPRPLSSEITSANSLIQLQMAKHQYSPLPDGWVRLLLLSPSRDEQSPVHCRLIDYCVSTPERGTHPYEALSYVWGLQSNCRTVLMGDSGQLPVTRNLYAALQRLRYSCFDRLLWVDSLCINQEDTQERSHQVELMGKIYSYASRVLVWLEEAVGEGPTITDSDEGLEELWAASNGQHSEGSQDTDELKKPVKSLLERSWFRRVWPDDELKENTSHQVLQEVAAARSVVMLSRSAEIDGQAFCLGLQAVLDAPGSLKQAHLHETTRSTAYLIQGAGLRPKRATRQEGKFSINMASLAELLDLYHDRQAIDPRDRVFALLGMSSDEIPPNLLPNYNIKWKEVLHNLIDFIFGQKLSVWVYKEVAFVYAKGWVLGTVMPEPIDTMKKRDVHTMPRRYVDLRGQWTISISATGYFPHNMDFLDCDVQTMVSSVHGGDVVCFFEGASKPTIIRPCQDYWSVIAVGASLKNSAAPPSGLWKSHLSNFLIAWDWDVQDTEKGAKNSDIEDFISSRLGEHTKCPLLRDGNLGKAARLMDMAMVWADRGDDKGAFKYVEKAATYVSNALPGSELSSFLACADTLARRCQPPFDDRVRVIADILGRRDVFVQVGKEGLLRAAQSSLEATRLILDRHGTTIEVTGEILEAVTGHVDDPDRPHRDYCGKDDICMLVKRLLDGNGSVGDQVSVKTILAAARLPRPDALMAIFLARSDAEQVPEEVVALLLTQTATFDKIWTIREPLFDRFIKQFNITAAVAEAAAEKAETEVMTQLLDHPRRQFIVTERLLVAVAGNYRDPVSVMELLLNQCDDDFEITDKIIEAVAARGRLDLMRLLLEKRRNQVTITYRAVELAAGNQMDYPRGSTWREVWNCDRDLLVKLLLMEGCPKVKVTAEVINAAAERDFPAVLMQWLFVRHDSDFKITEEITEKFVNHRRASRELVNLLFELRPHELNLSEQLVKRVVSMEGVMFVGSFLKRNPEFQVSEVLLKAAVANEDHPWTLTRLLLERSKIKVSEEVVKAAAENKMFGNYVVELLFERQPGIDVTENVAKAAAGNGTNGLLLMEFFFDKRGSAVTVTEQVLRTAARNERQGRDLMKLFLKRGVEIRTTKELMTAAAGNEWGGLDITKLLIKASGSEVNRAITVEVVAAAAGNKWFGYELVDLFLNRDIRFEANEEVAKAAAGNKRHGFELMRLFFDRGIKVEVTYEVVKAAANNHRCGHRLICLLAQKYGAGLGIIHITSEVWRAVVKNPRGEGAKVWLRNCLLAHSMGNT